MDDVATEIERLALFRPLAERHRRRLLALARVETAPADALLLQADEPSRRLWFVLEGRVALSLNPPGAGETLLLTLGPGELVGWSSMLPDANPRAVANVRAVEPVRLLAFDGPELQRLCEADHEIGWVVMRCVLAAVGRRLTETRLQLLDVYGRRG
jgi:CRP-like cAMP-binding protein